MELEEGGVPVGGREGGGGGWFRGSREKRGHGGRCAAHLSRLEERRRLMRFIRSESSGGDIVNPNQPDLWSGGNKAKFFTHSRHDRQF